MTSTKRSRFASLARAAAPIAILLAATATLLRFPPGKYNFYPRCPIFTLFHLQCPGCGSTRALAALLHGHLSEALRLNVFATVALPFVILWGAQSYRCFLQRKSLSWPQPPRCAIYGAFAITALFTIVRNL